MTNAQKAGLIDDLRLVRPDQFAEGLSILNFQSLEEVCAAESSIGSCVD